MLPEWYGEYKNFIESSINFYLEKYFEKNITNKGLERFKEIIFYSIKGGKKIRAIFALEFFLVFSGKEFKDISKEDDIIKFCIALELIHAYSLIHDDLPSMDNDEYRRGELTVWKKYSEYEAVLVGDLLNTLSFEVLSEIKNSNISVSLIKLLSNSTGFYGMIGGQVDDMYFEKNFDNLDLENLLKLHNKKTGALIKTSILGGILLSGYSGDLKRYEDFGEKIGLAFQIKDDILDVEGNFESTGKSVGGEEKGFVYFMGVEKSKEYLNNLINDCIFIVQNLESKKIQTIIEFVGNREK